MRKLVFAAGLALLAAGCVSESRYSSMGYMVTDDGYEGCAFRYGYYPYYDASGTATAARMEIVRVERLRLPRPIERTDDYAWASRPPSSGQTSGGTADQSSVMVDRSPISAPAPPPAPRVVGPRS
jgi:hypothetical protein